MKEAAKQRITEITRKHKPLNVEVMDTTEVEDAMD